jgi:predicted PurR-regulated permease PerM
MMVVLDPEMKRIDARISRSMFAMESIYLLCGRPAKPEGVSVKFSNVETAKRVWLISGCVTLLVAVCGAMWAGRQVLLLLFAGLLFAIVLSAVADWISQHLGVRRGLALALTVLILLVGSSLTAWLVGDRFYSQIQDLSEQLPSVLADLRQSLAQHRWGKAVLHNMPSPEDLLSHTSEVAKKSWSAAWGLVGLAGGSLIFFFVGIYLAIDPTGYRNGFVRLFPVSSRPRLAATLDSAGSTLARWLVGKLILMCMVGVLTAIGLWVLGIPLVLSLALLAATLDFIPNIGPIASAIPALLLAVLKGPSTVLWVALLYLAVQFLESYILSPLVQRRAVSLPPALLIAAQVFLPMTFGVPGLLLATPLTVLLLVLVRSLYVESILEQNDNANARNA